MNSSTSLAESDVQGGFDQFDFRTNQRMPRLGFAVGEFVFPSGV